MEDTTFYQASSNSLDLSQHLTPAMAAVDGWIEQNGLKLNEAKTQLLLFSREMRSDELRDVVVSLKGQEVSKVAKLASLGYGWMRVCLRKTTWKQREENVLEVYSARLYRLTDS